MMLFPFLPPARPGRTGGDTPKYTPSEYVKPSSGTTSVQQGNNTALGSNSSEQSIYQRKVSINVQSPPESKDITIEDPEFNPPVKIKKLALAIKIFCKSYKGMSQVNNPETDRSARVESLRKKVFTVSFAVIHSLSAVLTVAATVGLGIGAMMGVIFLGTLNPQALVLTIFVFMALSVIGPVLLFAGFQLALVIERFITGVVSASVDTREKLAEMTASTKPEAKFLNKYQRMEESLRALQIKRYAAKSKEIDEMPDSPLKNQLRTELESERVKEKIPKPDDEKWYDTCQPHCLKDYYVGSIESLDDAISKIEDWLRRADKQKNLLTKAQQELNVEGTSGKSDTEPMEVRHENSADWIPV